jgi:PAS domain S-box-containing protein
MTGRPESNAADDAMFQAILDAGADQVFALDEDGCYLAFNHAHAEAMRAVHGVGIALGDRGTDSLRTDADREAARTALGRALAGEKSSVRHIVHIGGRPRTFAVTFAPLPGDSGRVTGAVFYAHEITEQLRSEQAMREGEERFRAMFAGAPLGIALIDSYDGSIYEVNERFAEIAGRTVDEMRAIDWMSITHPDDVQMDLDEMARLNAGEIPGFQMDKRYLKPDGSAVWIRMTIAPLLEADGSHNRHLCMVDDITERKALEARFRARNTLLEATNRELEAFVYSASHDLRSPLRAIDGFSQMVIEDAAGRLSEEDIEHLQRVRRASQRMARLIDHLVALSRSDRREVQRCPVDLSAMAESVVEELRAAEPDRDVAFVAGPGIEVSADPELLRVILTNLLGNAWKFTSRQATARIEVGEDLVDEERAFYVRDDGVGLDVNEAPHLFGAFQRYHSPEEFDGDGIGLATVQRFVARHGGRAWAEAEPGQGATFSFTLPEPA